MTQAQNSIEIYLETGKKRTIAGAIDWPGWCRSGRDEDSALQALVDYGPRYNSALGSSRLGFQPPAQKSAFVVVERLAGNSTTDFGAPEATPSSDRASVDAAALERFQTLLQACWQAFDAAAEAATGVVLRTGPRGGGRELTGVIEHVMNVEGSYLGRLAWKRPKPDGTSLSEQLSQTRHAALQALAAAAAGETPERGPRGGVLWTPRYFVRRLAWHVLDHTWELEDRSG